MTTPPAPPAPGQPQQPPKPPEPKRKYRVKPGYTFGAQGQHKEGDEVELTEAEAAGFRERLEPVDPTPEEAKDIPQAQPVEPPAVPKQAPKKPASDA